MAKQDEERMRELDARLALPPPVLKTKKAKQLRLVYSAPRTAKICKHSLTTKIAKQRGQCFSCYRLGAK